MTIAFWCIFAAALLHVVTKAPVAKAQNDAGGYDNHYPRRQQAALDDWGQRALAAHQNYFEAFPLFVAGVLVATVGHTEQCIIDGLAVAWIISRLLYIWLYLADYANARSAIWGLSYTLAMALLTSPAWGGIAH
jgi:uncharacterized MAPEG superfamily protein